MPGAKYRRSWEVKNPLNISKIKVLWVPFVPQCDALLHIGSNRSSFPWVPKISIINVVPAYYRALNIHTAMS